MESIVEQVAKMRMLSTGSSSEGSEPVYFRPKPVGSDPLGQPVKIWSNVFPVSFENDGRQVHQYEVEVMLSREEFKEGTLPEKIFYVNRTPLEGARATQGKEVCGKLLEHIIRHETDVLLWSQIFYDHHRTLFATERIDDDQPIMCPVELAELEDQDPIFLPFTHAKVELTYRGTHQYSDNFVAALNGSLQAIARENTLSKFVEIVASKECLDQIATQRRIPNNPNGFLFRSCNMVYSTGGGEPLPEHKELLLGLRKTVDLIEGPEGRGHAKIGIPMDATKVCFLKEDLAIVTAEVVCGKQFNGPNSFNDVDIEKLNRVLKGVSVVTRYSNIHMNMKITRIVPVSALTQQFEHKGGFITVFDYFKTVRELTLQHPHAPLAQVSRGGRDSHFPLEAIGIMPGNVVATAKQTGPIMATIVRSSAMLPLARMNTILQQAHRQQVFGPNKAAGITVGAEPYEVSARVIGAPQFGYNGGVVNQFDDRGSWRVPPRAQYADTKRGLIKKWGFFLLTDMDYQSLTKKHQFNPADFGGRFILEANNKGLAVPTKFTIEKLVHANELEATFKAMSEENFDFGLFAMDDGLSMQVELKYLERKYKIPTQNAKLSTVKAVCTQNKAATLANIIQKFNCKLGGLCHTLTRPGIQFNDSLKKGEVFVFGIGDVVSPGAPVIPGQKEPEKKDDGFTEKDPIHVVMPYAGTFAPTPNSFIGDFEIEKMNLDQARVHGAVLLKRAIFTLKQAGRTLPKHIVVYRMGTTNHDIDRIMNFEIKQIRELIREEAGNDAKLIYIMAHKDHTLRFFKKDLNGRDTATKQNIAPGTVVDSCVTHPHRCQFFLNAHVGLQGTAKTPRYTVLHDDTKDATTLKYLEAMTFDLCCLHQIVNLPTALPVPLRVAEEYGKRGKNVLQQYIKEESVNSIQNVKQALEYKYVDNFKYRRINA